MEKDRLNGGSSDRNERKKKFSGVESLSHLARDMRVSTVSDLFSGRVSEIRVSLKAAEMSEGERRQLAKNEGGERRSGTRHKNGQTARRIRETLG